MRATRSALIHVVAELSLEEAIVLGDAKVGDGRLYCPKTGVNGTNYRNRALITYNGLGANRPQDAVYPTSEGPDALEKYSGADKYVVPVPKGGLPPVNGFGSITMYDKNHVFVPDAIDH